MCLLDRRHREIMQDEKMALRFDHQAVVASTTEKHQLLVDREVRQIMVTMESI